MKCDCAICLMEPMRLYPLQRIRVDLIWMATGNRQLTLCLVKCIEIIGEAATKITAETRGIYPEIPWGEIMTMRHRLIHGYFDIDLDRVWDTITDDLPPLVKHLSFILESEK